MAEVQVDLDEETLAAYQAIADREGISIGEAISNRIRPILLLLKSAPSVDEASIPSRIES
jgi:hypothetical protein